jgi:hypothetical protein
MEKYWGRHRFLASGEGEGTTGSQTFVLSSSRMLYITTANDPTIAAIEAISNNPNIFSPFQFIPMYLPRQI